MRTVLIPALRRLLVTAQGYAPRVRQAGADEVESAIRRASCIQLDSVATVVELDRPRPTAAVLLSPFDNLLWDTRFGQRVLGFEHVIELYKPAPQRRYGYYVLPFLWGDRIVGRADLKSERREGPLLVKAFHLEPGVRPSRRLDEAFDRALDRLRRTVGLERVVR